MKKIKIGISACLLGHAVRYDGGHKQVPFFTDLLSEWITFQPICPEVEIGMTVPREPINLVQVNGDIRVRSVTDPSLDYTTKLQQLAAAYVPQVGAMSGFIFMQKSPSCGLHHVKVHSDAGLLLRQNSNGAFAGELLHRLPYLPVEEAINLFDKAMCVQFLTRVFCRHDWLENVISSQSIQALESFHCRHSLLFESHSISHSKQLTTLIKNVEKQLQSEQLNDYATSFSQCLTQVASIDDHCRVLSDVLAQLNRHTNHQQANELKLIIKAFSERQLDLSSVLSSFHQIIRAVNHEYLMQQSYFKPLPPALNLKISNSLINELSM